MDNKLTNGVMINAYPDSCGGSLNAMIKMLNKKDFENVFSSFYILPSLFESDLDRGFSVVTYNLNKDLASKEDLKALRDKNISLKLDFVLNHLSVQSPMFKDMLEKGDDSEFIDTFIDWNKFWKGKGTISTEGYIIPDDAYLSKLFMRKPGLPILKVPFPDGSYRFYWNTFYQKVTLKLPQIKDLLKIEGIDENSAKKIIDSLKDAIKNDIPVGKIDFGITGKNRDNIIHFIERNFTTYLGQMDLNGESEKVWDFYKDTFSKLSSYGAKIVRLDAFAYMHKQIGLTNFFNEPGTWDYLARIKEIADSYNLILLPEIHGKYEEMIHDQIAQKGYPIYDFFFPGLVLHAIENAENRHLKSWITEIKNKKYKTVNMLGCHDGIPVLDVKGLLKEEDITGLMTLVKQRGGRVKDLFDAEGKKISYYQINATFFSALGESEKKLLLARAIQIFMPGIPDVWYLDLFAGKNDYLAADTIGHKDINRTNLTMREIENGLKTSIVQEQLSLLRFRNTHKAFGFDSKLTIEDCSNNQLKLTWENGTHFASLSADLKTHEYKIESN